MVSLQPANHFMDCLHLVRYPLGVKCVSFAPKAAERRSNLVRNRNEVTPPTTLLSFKSTGIGFLPGRRIRLREVMPIREDSVNLSKLVIKRRNDE